MNLSYLLTWVPLLGLAVGRPIPDSGEGIPGEDDLEGVIKIQKEDVHRGDIKQSGAFGGQNFSIFTFKGAQMAIYMFSPFSIYFADEAQDNEVENEGDDASSKNQYLSQSKYGLQRGEGPRFLYQPNFDNKRKISVIRNLLAEREKQKKPKGYGYGQHHAHGHHGHHLGY